MNTCKEGINDMIIKKSHDIDKFFDSLLLKGIITNKLGVGNFVEYDHMILEILLWFP